MPIFLDQPINFLVLEQEILLPNFFTGCPFFPQTPNPGLHFGLGRLGNFLIQLQTPIMVNLDSMGCLSGEIMVLFDQGQFNFIFDVPGVG